jgi:CO dehydrogenase maturation factor
MAKTIAITGKGGVGKTVVAALTVRLLVEAKRGPVLAVDADPNLNLNSALGLAVGQTVGDVREEGLDRAAQLPGGMAKTDFLRMRVQEALVESEGFDLLAMGRPEGPGCYCFANTILRACVDHISKQYAYVVIDCEAGLEHLSRRTAGDLDVLLILSDPTIRGLDTAARVMELAGSLGTKVAQTAFAFSRVADAIPAALADAARQRGLPTPFTVPEDAQIRSFDARGEPLVAVPPDSPVLGAVRSILTEVCLLSP